MIVRGGRRLASGVLARPKLHTGVGFSAVSRQQREVADRFTRDSLDESLRNDPCGRNFIAKGVFRTMNLAMRCEGQPITREHHSVLRDSLLTRKAGLFRTLWAENEHVMQSEGSTFVYKLGKNLVHRPIYAARHAAKWFTGDQ
jgi:hypothetical protein